MLQILREFVTSCRDSPRFRFPRSQKGLPRTRPNSPLGYASSLRAGKIKPTTHKRKEGLTDTHERTAILLAAALRTHGKLLPLPSSAKGLRLHPRPHGERRAPAAGTPRRLRKAKLLPSRGRTDRKQPGVHRDRQGTPRRVFQIGGVLTLRVRPTSENSTSTH